MTGGLKAFGVAVLLVEQRVESALAVADRVAFIENGPVRHAANPAALAAIQHPERLMCAVTDCNSRTHSPVVDATA